MMRSMSWTPPPRSNDLDVYRRLARVEPLLATGSSNDVVAGAPPSAPKGAARLLGSSRAGPSLYHPAPDMANKTGNARGSDWNVFTHGSPSQSHGFARGNHELGASARDG
jgi:hypothetical protein